MALRPSRFNVEVRTPNGRRGTYNSLSNRFVSAESTAEQLAQAGILVEEPAPEHEVFRTAVDRQRATAEGVDVLVVTAPDDGHAAEERQTFANIRRFIADAEPSQEAMVKLRLCGFSRRPLESRLAAYSGLLRAAGREARVVRSWMTDDIVRDTFPPPAMADAFFGMYNAARPPERKSLFANAYSNIVRVASSRKPLYLGIAAQSAADVEIHREFFLGLASTLERPSLPMLSFGVEVRASAGVLYGQPQVCAPLDDELEDLRSAIMAALTSFGIPAFPQVVPAHKHLRCPCASARTRAFDWHGREYRCYWQVGDTAGSTGHVPGQHLDAAFREAMASACCECALLPLCFNECPKLGLESRCAMRREILQKRLESLFAQWIART